MTSFIINLFKFIKSITLKDVVYVIIILVLAGALSSSIQQCSDIKQEYKNNIAALNDTIHEYKAKNGNLVATKLAFESDLKTLELLNEDLCNEIDNLKMKGNATNATYFEGIIENPQVDTAFIVKHDTISKGFSHDFAFNNEYRTLEGNVKYQNDSVGVKIQKDEIKFDYTVAMDDKNNIYITSKNPYVKYNQLTGFQVHKEKQKRWSIGPAVGVGYDPLQNRFGINLGVSFNYGIIRF